MSQNFANYELTDIHATPRALLEMGDGVLPEMARVFEIELGEEPTPATLGALVGAIGRSKVLQENIEGVRETLGTEDDALGIASDWVIRAAVQEPLNRSLWTPRIETPHEVDGIVITGAVANWQDRTTRLLEARVEAGNLPSRIYIPVGQRVMDSATEKTNPNIAAFNDAYDSYPTEAVYAEEVVAPQLREAGYDVAVLPFDTNDGEAIAARFAHDHIEKTIGSTILFARVANAGLQLAVQFRQAIRRHGSRFDGDSGNPQVYVATDSFPVATTAEQAANPREFQNPMTAIRQVALSAKVLYETA